MRVYFGPIVRDPIRTIAARAVDGDYYFSLPKGFCVLDKTKPADERILDEMRNQLLAASEAQAVRAPRGAVGSEVQKLEQAAQTAISGVFVLCDELQQYQVTGDRRSLTLLGTATGSRQGRRIPRPMRASSICRG